MLLVLIYASLPAIMAFIAHTEKIVYGDGVVNLFVDMGVGIGGDKWPAADVFCKIISDDKWKPYFSTLFRNRTCLELGSGTGDAFFDVDDLIIIPCSRFSWDSY